MPGVLVLRVTAAPRGGALAASHSHVGAQHQLPDVYLHNGAPARVRAPPASESSRDVSSSMLVCVRTQISPHNHHHHHTHTAPRGQLSSRVAPGGAERAAMPQQDTRMVCGCGQCAAGRVPGGPLVGMAVWTWVLVVGGGRCSKAGAGHK